MPPDFSRADPLLEKPRAWLRQKRRAVACEAAARILGWALAAAAAVSAADEAFALNHAARWGAWCAGAAVFLAELWALALGPWLRADWRDILAAAEETFPALKNFLKTAWDLARAPEDGATSSALRAAHLEKTRTLLSSLPETPVFTWTPSSAAQLSAIVGILGAAFLLWARPAQSLRRVAEPWNDKPLESFLALSPGNADIPWGQNVLIRASWQASSLIARSPQDLTLWVKDESGWRAEPWDFHDSGLAEFTAESLTAALSYKVSWRDLSTRTCVLRPIPEPGWKNLELGVSGLNQRDEIPLDGSRILQFLIGSRMTVSGTPSEAFSRAGIVFSTPSASLPMLRRPSGDYAASFTLTRGVTFSFALETPDGRRNAEASEYSIAALADEPPTIEVLSPDSQISASPGGVIPISYAAQDDGGLTRVALVVRGPDGRQTRTALRAFSDEPKQYVGDYAWSLSGFVPGRFEFGLEAWDNAIPSHSAFSGWQPLILADWEKIRHDENHLWDKAQADMQSLAAQEKQYLNALSAPPPASSAELSKTAQNLSRNWDSAAQDAARLASAFSQDPQADPWQAENLENLARAASQAAQESSSSASRASQSGTRAQDEALHRSLARLAARESGLLKAGRQAESWRDASATAQNLSDAGASLLGDLSRGNPSRNSSAARALGQKISQIQKRLSALEQQAQSLASPSSGQFQGPPPQSIPFDRAMDEAQALQKALASGDIAAAQRLADQLSRDLSQISRDMRAAASGALSSTEQQELSQARAAAVLWSRVIAEQESARDSARALAAKMAKSRVERQKKILAELAKEQAALDLQASADAAFPYPALEQMKNAKSQFSSGQVSDAGMRLLDAVGILRASEPASHPERDFQNSVAAKEQDILSRLGQAAAPSAPAPGPESAAAASQQEMVRSQTLDLESNLKSLQGGGIELPPDSMQNVSEATREQGLAQSALDAGDAPSALSHQENALSLLSSGANGFSNAASGEERMLSISEGGSGGEVFGGASGDQMGVVPLPSARDYLPPEVLRAELEQSMGEARPENYGPLLRQYFQRLAQ